MGTYLNQYRLSQSGEFMGIIRQAVLHAALDVRNEPEDTEDHVKRRQLADIVYGNAGQFEAGVLWQFARLCSSNQKIATDAVVDGMVLPANIEDGDVEYVIASNWTAVALGLN